MRGPQHHVLPDIIPGDHISFGGGRVFTVASVIFAPDRGLFSYETVERVRGDEVEIRVARERVPAQPAGGWQGMMPNAMPTPGIVIDAHGVEPAAIGEIFSIAMMIGEHWRTQEGVNAALIDRLGGDA